MRSLQARMFLVFALIATIPLLAMSYLALSATGDALASEVGRANGDAAKAAAGFVDVYVENGRVLLGAEARSLQIRQAVAADDRPAMLASAQELRAAATYQLRPIFRGVAVYDANGALVAVSPPDADPLMQDAEHLAAVQVVLSRGAPLSPPPAPTGEPILPLLTPVFSNGTVIGVFAGDLSLSALSHALAPFAAAQQTVFVTDENGRLLAHPNATILAERPDWSGLAPLRRAAASTSGYVEYVDPATGETALGSFAIIPGLRWVIVDSVPTSIAYAALQKLTGVLIALSGLLVGAILLASVAVARRIVAPVQELTEAARDLAEGRLGRRLHPTGDDEIAELARAFDQMADRIAESLEGLRRSETRYRSLVESASDLIFTIQPGGALSFTSPMMRAVLGEETRGRVAAEQLVHPEDREVFGAAVKRVLAAGEPALFVPFRFLTSAGEVRAVVTNFTPIYETGDQPARVLAVAHDVTEERRQQEMRERAFQMARLVSEETTLDALAHRGLTLILAASGLQRGVTFLVRSGRLREAARVGVKDAQTFVVLAADARTRAAPVTGRVGEEAAIALPLLEHGEVIGVVAVAGGAVRPDGEAEVLAPLASQLAVGLRRSLFEQRLKEYAAELESRVAERTQELTQKSGEMEQFLYSVSHDLKAPLISIQGYAQGLEEDYAEALAGDGALYLDRIRKNASLMESLIMDILELSRIGRTQRDPERVDIEALLEGVRTRMADRFAAAGGRFETVGPFPAVEAERRRLEQLFGNLVDNALKYRHPGRPPVVTIKATTTPDEAIFSIADNGRGIPARYHDRVFKIFQRIPTPEMDDPGGTGMGLAIVNRIAQTQGGRVWFESREGEGTTFHVALPRERTAGGAP